MMRKIQHIRNNVVVRQYRNFTCSSITGQGEKSWGMSEKKSRPVQPKKTGMAGRAIQESLGSLNEMEEIKRQELERNSIDNSLVKKFQHGSTYDPFDFSLAKLRLDKSEHQKAAKTDLFAEVKLNPVSLWKDAETLSSFVSVNGRILPGYLIGTKGKTQRRLAKAIRRCRAAGLLSPVHKSVDHLSTRNEW
jgi:ribosomal protein S18